MDAAVSSEGRMSAEDVAARDELLRKYVSLRLTARQVHELSQSWAWPFPHVNHVWRRVERLRLKVIEERGQLPHKRAIAEVLCRLSRCAAMNGYRLNDVRIEASLGEGSGVRSDLHVVIEGKGVRRVRIFEVQLTRMAGWLWRRKLERVKRWRKRKGVEPFRCVLLVEDRDAAEAFKFHEVNKAYKIACEVMRDSPNMCLFLVDWNPDFRVQFDVLAEDIFMSNQKRREALL
jgi:hypothetical protein